MDGEFGNVIKKFLSFNRFRAADEASNEAKEAEQPQEPAQAEEDSVEAGTLLAETDGSNVEEEESTGAQQGDASGEDVVNWCDDAQLEGEGDVVEHEMEYQEEDEQFGTQAEEDNDDLSSLSVEELYQRCLEAKVKLPDGIVGKAKLVQLLAEKLGLNQGGPVEPAEPPPAALVAGPVQPAGPPPAALVAKRKRSIDLRKGPFPKSGLLGGPQPPSFPPPPPPHQPGLAKAPKDAPPKAGSPVVVPPVTKCMPGKKDSKVRKMVATAKKAPRPPAEPPPGPRPPTEPPPQRHLPKQPTQPPHPPTKPPNEEAKQRPEALPPTVPPQFHQPGQIPHIVQPGPLPNLEQQAKKLQAQQATQQLQDQLKQKRAQELLQHLSQQRAKEHHKEQQLKFAAAAGALIRKQQETQQAESAPPTTAAIAASTSHSVGGGSLTAFQEAEMKLNQSEEDKIKVRNLGETLGLDVWVQLGLMLLSQEKLRPILGWLPKINGAAGDKNATARLCIEKSDPEVAELLKRVEEEESQQISQNTNSAAQAPNGLAAPKTPPKAPPKAIPNAPRKDDTQANAKAAARTACLAAQASAASATYPLQTPQSNQQPGACAGMPAKIAVSIPPVEKAKAPPFLEAPQRMPPTAKAHVTAPHKPQTVPPKANMHIAGSPMMVQSTRPQKPVQSLQPVQPAPAAQHPAHLALRPGLHNNFRPPMPCNPRPASAQELRSNPVGVGVTNVRPPGKGHTAATTTLPGKGVAQRARSRSRSPPVPKQPQPPAMPPPRAAEKQVMKSSGQPRDELDAWLEGLGDKGVMLQYSAAVHREFDSVSQLSAAVVDPSAKGLKVVEPAIWETLGIKALGHKLHFSKGLQKLVSSES